MIFNKIFGRGDKPPTESFAQREAREKTERDRKAGQEIIERTAKLDAAIAQNELNIPDRAEANESPRIVKCYQFKFGKGVQRADGPIEKGVDHHLTAVPTDLNMRKLAGLTHPTRLPFGTDDLTDWKKMPYFPIVKVTRVVDGVPYVVCGLASGRSEDGADITKGRIYSESHYIAIPASEWSVALVPQLTSILNNTPRVVGEPVEMPEIEVSTDILDKPLPADWFSKSKDILVRLAGGQTLSYQVWSASEQQNFLQNLFFAMICLPENVARRMSFGSGIAYKNIGEGNVGLRAFLGTTGFSYGRPLKIMDKPWAYDDVTKLRLGEEYIAALSPLVASVQTPREVMRAVTQLPDNIRSQTTKRIFPQ